MVPVDSIVVAERIIITEEDVIFICSLTRRLCFACRYVGIQSDDSLSLSLPLALSLSLLNRHDRAESPFVQTCAWFEPREGCVLVSARADDR